MRVGPRPPREVPAVDATFKFAEPVSIFDEVGEREINFSIRSRVLL